VHWIAGLSAHEFPVPAAGLIPTSVILTEAATLSALAVLPYAAARKRRALAAASLLRTLLVSQLVYGSVSIVGLWLGSRLGLGSPLIEAIVTSQPIPADPGAPLIWFLSGVGAAMTVWILDVLCFAGARRSFAAAPISTPPALLRAGALLYGAIAEEVLTRLGVLTLVGFALAWLLGEADWPDHRAALAAAIAVSSLIFAAGHLPITARLAPLTARVVLRAILLNGVAGLVFGTLYCVYGLEAAMVAHGGADLVILYLVPVLRR
jgi:Type II CAAX prenyl endopeptidase Rce1-like